jgi:hypothetical protein
VQCPLEHGTFIHFSSTLSGPWESAGKLQTNTTGCVGCGSSNPAPYIFPNGTVIMLGRSQDYANHHHNIFLYVDTRESERAREKDREKEREHAKVETTLPLVSHIARV